MADLVGKHPRTTQDWIAWYRQGGLEEVLRHHHGGHGGKASWLTEEQLEALEAATSAGQVRSIQDGVQWAQEQYGVTYTYWGMHGVFARLELRKKVPRPRNPKASAEQQSLEKRGLSAELEAIGCAGVAGVYWSDEMRVGLMGQVRRVWTPRGVKVEQVLEYKRQWTYLNLAVNGLTGQVKWDWTENMKGVSIALVVKQWFEQGVEVVV